MKQILTRQEEIKRVIALAGGRQLELSRPLVMGVLNVTPDSFSDGGLWDSTERALEQAEKMIGEGADLIDIGGESTRPGAKPVKPETEQERVLPVIKAIRKVSDIPISIDTYRAETARRALDAGADIVNDISALRFDPDLAAVVAKNNVPVILMHMLGTPRDMQQNPRYTDCVPEISDFFEERIAYATGCGIDKSKIIFDPGIGFGKRLADNIDIIANLGEFKRHGVPLLIGTSRKRFIEMLDQTDSEPHERLGGSVASAVMAVVNGADIVRVHDVAQTITALKVTQAIRDAR